MRLPISFFRDKYLSMMTRDEQLFQSLPEDLDPSNYDYDLPEEQIAKRPVSPRDHSRLLVYNRATGEIHHSSFFKLHEFLEKGTRLIFNQSKVFPCRLMAKKESGGKAEIFVLSLKKNREGVPCLIKSGNKKKLGQNYHFNSDCFATLVGINDDGSFELAFNKEVESVVQELGMTPIPPYIRDGVSDEQDKKDYQTVYAKDAGSVAAPTAGLHFTENVFKNLADKEIERSFVTLHVGLGTFAPLKYQQLEERKLHKEMFIIENSDWENIQASPKKIAVGTTSLRALESLNKPGVWSETDIFIYPGYDIKSVDGLLTNFHLPKSSLMMLVSAFIGREKTLELYQTAVKENYRFFSYGDAMLIL